LFFFFVLLAVPVVVVNVNAAATSSIADAADKIQTTKTSCSTALRNEDDNYECRDLLLTAPKNGLVSLLLN